MKNVLFFGESADWWSAYFNPKELLFPSVLLAILREHQQVLKIDVYLNLTVHVVSFEQLPFQCGMEYFIPPYYPT